MRTFGDAASYAFANLRRHRLRTALTACGVAVGVATLVVMVSLGSGLRLLASSQFDKAELITRVWVLRKGTQSGMKNGLMGGGAAAKAPSGAPITDEVVDQLAKLPGVITAYPELTTPVTVEANGLITSTAVDGVPVAALTASYQDAMIAGSLWEDESAVDVCVLPSVACSDLGFATPQDAIGARIAVARYQSVFRYRPVTIKAPNPDDPSGPPLEETQFQRPDGLEVHELDVIGVYDTKQLGYVGRFLLVPEGTGRGLYGRFLPRMGVDGGEYRRAIVKVGDHRQLDSVREAIERLGFETQTVFDVLNVLKIVFAVFQLLLSFFGGIGLVVAFFGIVNTMLMAVLERTREIGVLKALGARNSDVRRVFVTEAAAIGLSGGLLGLGFGWVVGQVLNLVANRLVNDSEALGGGVFVVEPWLAVGSLLLASAVAAVAGFYPAWRAARLDPVEALRRD